MRSAPVACNDLLGCASLSGKDCPSIRRTRLVPPLVTHYLMPVAIWIDRRVVPVPSAPPIVRSRASPPRHAALEPHYYNGSQVVPAQPNANYTAEPLAQTSSFLASNAIRATPEFLPAPPRFSHTCSNLMQRFRAA